MHRNQRKFGNGHGRRHRGRYHTPYGYRNYRRHHQRNDGAENWRSPITPSSILRNTETTNPQPSLESMITSSTSEASSLPPLIKCESDSDMDMSTVGEACVKVEAPEPITPTTVASESTTTSKPNGPDDFIEFYQNPDLVTQSNCAHHFSPEPTSILSELPDLSSDDEETPEIYACVANLFRPTTPPPSTETTNNAEASTPANSTVTCSPLGTTSIPGLPLFPSLDYFIPSNEPTTSTYKEYTMSCSNNSNVLGVDIGCNVDAHGEIMYNQFRSDYTNRGLKTLLVRSFRSATDAANRDKYVPIGETLKWEARFIVTNNDVATLLHDAAHSRVMNDTFRTGTGVQDMIEGLESIVRPDDDIRGAINFATRHLHNKIDDYLKQKNVTILLPNGEHYGEYGRMFKATDVIAMSHYIKKDPDDFDYEKSLRPLPNRGFASKFLIPRFNCIGTSIVNKFFLVRFGTRANPKVEKTPVAKGFYVSLHD